MVLHAPTGVIDSVTFNIWKKESIRKLAVIEIDNPVLYVNQKPSLKSLRDPRLGITSRKGQCQTCGLSWKMCPLGTQASTPRSKWKLQKHILKLPESEGNGDTQTDASIQCNENYPEMGFIETRDQIHNSNLCKNAIRFLSASWH